MNSLTQTDCGILGSDQAVAAFGKAENARILVLSDSHGHYGVVEEIIREYGPGCDALFFAGDGMWDIVQYIENAQESNRLRDALPPVVVFVAGNGDGDQYRISLPVSGDVPEPGENPGFTIMVPARQIIRTCGYGILLVHGHRHSVDVSMEILVGSAHAMDCDIAIYGHSHIRFAEAFSHILALNPGSPARPRGHFGPGFAILELDSTLTEPKVEFINL